MKRMLFALALAAGIAAAAYGAAASLGIGDTPTLQVGATVDGLQCDTDGVSMHLTTNGAVVNPYIDTITITGIDPHCNGKEIRVDFFDAGNNWLASWNPVPAVGGIVSPTAFFFGVGPDATLTTRSS